MADIGMDKVDILGCKFNAWSTADTLNEIEKLIKSGGRDYCCTVNVSILMMLRRDPRLRSIILNSGMVVADGQPLIWASRYIKHPLPERVTGVELVPKLAQLAENNGWGIYLMGATTEVVGKVVERLKTEFPEVTISGFDNGYFDNNEEARARAKKIRLSGAKILIVAMGVPRQEYFIEEHWRDIGANFVIGVGGSFDVLAGVTKRAPLWVQHIGFEWLYRAIQEPRRLFMRYLTTNSRFIYLFVKEIVLGLRQ